MKKFLALVIALVLTLSLAACGGGVDASAATDAFNTTNNALTEVSTLANDNIDMMDAEVTGALTEIATAFAGYKAELESSDLTQERADEIVSELAAYPDQIAGLKAQVEALISGEGAGEEPSAGGSSLLDTVSFYVVPDGIVGSTWDFGGAYIDGAELDADQVNEVLAQYGGSLQIVFNDDANATMVQGNGEMAGIYELDADGGTLNMQFSDGTTDYPYAARFTDIGGTAVMMLFPDSTGMNAFYFSQTA